MTTPHSAAKRLQHTVEVFIAFREDYRGKMKLTEGKKGVIKNHRQQPWMYQCTAQLGTLEPKSPRRFSHLHKPQSGKRLVSLSRPTYSTNNPPRRLSSSGRGAPRSQLPDWDSLHTCTQSTQPLQYVSSRCFTHSASACCVSLRGSRASRPP